MRTIKFRAWYKGCQFPLDLQNLEDYEKPQMIYNVQKLYDGSGADLNGILGGYSAFGSLVNNEDFVIQQFTGLTDKNGKEIYEGDIVTYKRSIGNWTGQYMTTTHKIVFSEEVFAFVMEYGSSYIKLRKHWGYEYEVIGNIYENPELLKKE
jgi:uncharacterized phage protein (TIGR01671 family)